MRAILRILLLVVVLLLFGASQSVFAGETDLRGSGAGLFAAGDDVVLMAGGDSRDSDRRAFIRRPIKRRVFFDRPFRRPFNRRPFIRRPIRRRVFFDDDDFFFDRPIRRRVIFDDDDDDFFFRRDRDDD